MSYFLFLFLTCWNQTIYDWATPVWSR